MSKIGKRMQTSKEKVDATASYELGDAVDLAKQCAGAKFDETLEIALNLGVDPRHADQMVRGVCILPHGTGKVVKVMVFARGAKAEEAINAGADMVGAEELVEAVQKGNFDVNRCIATPDMMPLVGRLGRILGPRGLMPNPKLGTVTMDVAKAVSDAKGGSVEYRVEKTGIIHAGVGKMSFEREQLIENVKALVSSVVAAKPSGVKGNYLKRASLSSTMGPGIHLGLANLTS